MDVLAEDVAFHSTIPVTADITVAIVYSVFGVCSVLGNSTLLYVSYKKKHLLKPAEFFIINLAVSDMGLTLSLYPMAISSSIYHRWLFGKTVCSIYAFCGMLFGLCSLTTLTLLSMVCFVKVCYPHYGNRFGPAHGCLLVACAWAWALMFAGSPLAHWGEYGPEPYGTACCVDWRASNEQATARSYTAALFVLCYMVPCCVIVASYASILATVCASRKALEQHAARQTHMSSIQMTIVKMSVAVCIGFFAAWSPYAIVSMWATFGPIENIPPLAFAMPAMFAKSSTIYNPVVYLLLRPNFRRVMRRDLGTLRRACAKGCLCPKGLGKWRSEAVARVSLRAFQQRHHHSSATDSSARPPFLPRAAGQEVSKGCSSEKCSDAFECFQHYPQVCLSARPEGKAPGGARELQACPGEAPAPPQPQRRAEPKVKKPRRATIRGKRSSEIDNLLVNLQVAPGPAKVAWP
ncbi:opsin-5-like [Aplochiton taeniatus]